MRKEANMVFQKKGRKGANRAQVGGGKKKKKKKGRVDTGRSAVKSTIMARQRNRARRTGG